MENATPYSQLPERIKLVFRDCARRHDVPVNRLIGTGRRERSVSMARREVSLALRRMGKTFPEIGRYMGVHHSSIMSQLKLADPKPLEPLQGPWFIPDYSGEWAI